MGYHGCGDNYCVLGPPEGGTGTNGGCSCFDALLLRRGVLSLRAELAEVVIERSEADSCRRKEAERADAAEAEVERLRGELEVDRKAGKDQWLWANDSDEPTYNHRRNDSLQTPCELCKARAEIVRLRARDGRLQAEVRRLIDMAEGNAKELDGPGGIVDKWRADERRADRAEAERDDMKRRLCAEMALRLQGGAVPHATPHSVAHGQFGLVEADRLFPRQAQEGGDR